ncbi:MAG: NapC/NirT family cytochrome c [Verrucomicrobiota bacterium]|jgi:nitrate/TMAO reductase-like tetraheme cytochrome c subunit
MSTENPVPNSSRPSLLRNWLSLSGLVIALGSLFSFLLLFVLDSLAHFANPYIGVLTYLVAPGFLMLGLGLAILGLLLRRWRIARAGGAASSAIKIDLSRPRDRRLMGFFISGAVAFLLVSAVGSYHTYNFTESVQFCGEACHTVMKPELVTYQHGPHARVACAECHIGPGATWFVRSKLSGTYQVYATAFDKYPRPIPTPIRNLRPAQETCEECHWPKKFVGNLDRTYSCFLGDETNSTYTVRLLIKVGGGDPTHGPVGGIHWHMTVGNTVEYLATDPGRQRIPWVRVTDFQGVVTVFREPKFTNDISQYEIRKMDCMDCHNRPAHRYMSPDSAVNLALSLREIDPALPWIKTNAVYALTHNYKTDRDARDGIATLLAERYPNDPRIRQAIPFVQQIYEDNFFPEMKASWKVYPDNIGHLIWPGCFRCHDGRHKTENDKRTIKADDCNACHTILTQGSGAQLEQITPAGQKFVHPGDEIDPSSLCNECHDGTF